MTEESSTTRLTSPREFKAEMQLKVLQQFSGLAIGAAGGALTLAGTVLDKSNPLTWIPVAPFFLGALVAMVAQTHLVSCVRRDMPLPNGQLSLALIGWCLGAGSATLVLALMRAS